MYQKVFNEHIQVAADTAKRLETPLNLLIEACAKSVAAGGKLMFCGNGGSAADAQHIATELSVRYVGDRAPIAALALTTDTSALTAAANDMGYEQVFARQVLALGRKGDVVVGISTSGKSRNVVLALETARQMGIVTAAFTGDNGALMTSLADHLINVPSTVTARIQEMHITLGHLLCESLEKRLGLV
ncbi:MAG: D-sedoheptulose 7-phosphate isomerase [Parvibaculum sp.]|nr:D-sedoheptulose 7-phosphate isomerase [Parvibaculum sp.]